MKYICLGYIDHAKFAALPQAEAMRLMEECMAYDDVLRRGGHFLGGEALNFPKTAVTLRGDRTGEIEILDGPFTETKEALGGILLLEARDMNHAIALMSKHPGVRMGPFEIRPAHEGVNQMNAERAAKVQREKT